jgi:hypothetical protein
VTSWATDYDGELTLVGWVRRGVAHHPFLPVVMLTGTLAEATGPIALAVGRGEAPSAAPELWSALGLRPRTFLDLVVTAPVAPVAVTELSGPPVSLDLGLDSTTAGTASPRRRAVITEGPADGAARGQAG